MRRHTGKALGVAVAVLLAPLAMLGLAAPASATAARPLTPDGVWSCRQLANGPLCIRYINGFTGVDIKYQKLSGSPIDADFRYHDDTFGTDHGDNGRFHQTAGQTKSFAWNNTFPGCVTGFIDVVNQGSIPTNSICPG